MIAGVLDAFTSSKAVLLLMFVVVEKLFSLVGWSCGESSRLSLWPDIVIKSWLVLIDSVVGLRQISAGSHLSLCSKLAPLTLCFSVDRPAVESVAFSLSWE